MIFDEMFVHLIVISMPFMVACNPFEGIIFYYLAWRVQDQEPAGLVCSGGFRLGQRNHVHFAGA